MAKNAFEFLYLSLRPQTSAPTSPRNGDMYYDQSGGVLKLYQEGNWVDVGTVSGNNSLAVTSISANYTASTSDQVILTDATSTAITITLPAASGNSGKFFYIKRIDQSVHAITLDGNGAETIDGDTTHILDVQYDCCFIVCDGSNWYIL